MTASHLMKSPCPPLNRPHKNTEDHRAEFAAISAKTPVDEEFRTAFLRNKLLIVRTHPKLDIAARNQAVASLIDRLGKEAAESVTEPRPGGVGEGFFYTADFKTNWGLGTSLSCDFVCPVPPGGNVSTWLYLTATNRSGLGVEAFVAYNGQDTPYFRVYDWARSDPWQTDIPFTSLLITSPRCLHMAINTRCSRCGTVLGRSTRLPIATRRCSTITCAGVGIWFTNMTMPPRTHSRKLVGRAPGPRSWRHSNRSIPLRTPWVRWIRS